MISGALLLLSVVPQVVASIQRWRLHGTVMGASYPFVEDHNYDYNSPSDPWTNTGASAQYHGVGIVMVAAGLLVLVLAVTTVWLRRRRLLLALGVIASTGFLLEGLHALFSGIGGAPSPLETVSVVVASAGMLAMISLAILCAGRVPVWGVAVALLVGNTSVGYAVSSLFLTPMLTGYVPFDSTPWHEVVVAIGTALAAVVVFVGVWTVRRRGGPEAFGPHPAGDRPVAARVEEGVSVPG